MRPRFLSVVGNVNRASCLELYVHCAEGDTQQARAQIGCCWHIEVTSAQTGRLTVCNKLYFVLELHTDVSSCSLDYFHIPRTIAGHDGQDV
jgi:hypothetical protein